MQYRDDYDPSLNEYEIQNNKLIENLLKKLIDDTKCRFINWNRLDLVIFNSSDFQESDNEFSVLPLTRTRYNREGNHVEEYLESKTYGTESELSGEQYSFNMKNGTTLLLLGFKDRQQLERNITTYEIWFTNENSLPQCLCTSNESCFSELVYNLFDSIYVYIQHENLNKCYLKDIDEYMNCDFNSLPQY